MLSRVNTQRSECDKQRIFAHVGGLKGGFAALDRSVLQTMTDWLQKQLALVATIGSALCSSCRKMQPLQVIQSQRAPRANGNCSVQWPF
jgi:hypothetical protein